MERKLLIILGICLALALEGKTSSEEVAEEEVDEEEGKTSSEEEEGVTEKREVVHSARVRRNIEQFNSITNNVVPVLQGITTALGKDGYNIQRFAGVVAKLGPALGILGPVMGLATSILGVALGGGDSPELAYMKRAFDKVFQQLNRLESKIGEIEDAVERVAVYSAYKQNYDKLRRINLMFKRFSESPERSTEYDLRHECGNHNPKHTLDWIHQRVVNPRIEPNLLPTILQGTSYDIRKFDLWMKIILADSFAAGVLDQACLGVGEPKPSDHIMKKDAAEVQRKLNEINSKLNEYQNKLKQDVIPVGQFEKDMDNLLRQGGDKTAKSDRIKKFMDAKYNWLYWSAAVYSECAGFDNHCTTGASKSLRYAGTWNKFRWHGVNVVVTWSPKPTRISSSKYSNSLICGAAGSERHARRAYDRVRNTLVQKRVSHNAIMAVRRGNGLTMKFNPGPVSAYVCKGVIVAVMHT